MATIPKNLAQALAMQSTINQQKERLQRSGYVTGKQTEMAINNHLKQTGYNGGAAESILLKLRGNLPDVSAYDTQLAALAPIIAGFRAARGRGGYGAGSGAAASINAGAQRSNGAMNTAALLSKSGNGGYGYNQNRRYNVGSYR